MNSLMEESRIKRKKIIFIFSSFSSIPQVIFKDFPQTIWGWVLHKIHSSIGKRNIYKKKKKKLNFVKQKVF